MVLGAESFVDWISYLLHAIGTECDELLVQLNQLINEWLLHTGTFIKTSMLTCHFVVKMLRLMPQFTFIFDGSLYGHPS
jgi:hypothetical protein